MLTFAEQVIQFNKTIEFTGKLPRGIRIMNPFQENPEVLTIVEQFYKTYYNDCRKRRLILGINPGRLGAGATGIPFTDTKRLAHKCGIKVRSIRTHEPSSVFVYDLIDRYGGVGKFYNDFYITSVCPLGFLSQSSKGTWVNCNYYNFDTLYQCVRPFILSSLKKLISFGIESDKVYLLGKKNARYFNLLRQDLKYFREVITLEHPRYIEQYKAASRNTYIRQFIRKLSLKSV